MITDYRRLDSKFFSRYKAKFNFFFKNSNRNELLKSYTYKFINDIILISWWIKLVFIMLLTRMLIIMLIEKMTINSEWTSIECFSLQSVVITIEEEEKSNLKFSKMISFFKIILYIAIILAVIAVTVANLTPIDKRSLKSLCG